MNYPEFKVFVRCITYNQSRFITDAMDSFTMQQTDFPYVCCIIDDASTDGEPEVIKQYLDRYFEVPANAKSHWETDYASVCFMHHKTNINCYFIVMLLKFNHYQLNLGRKKSEYISEWRKLCKYEAVCEGDDYWVSRDKIQKQIDFLDSHPDYSMCFHSASIKYEDEGLITRLKCQNLKERDYTEKDVISDWIVPTASIVFDIKKVLSQELRFRKWFCRGDLPLILRCMKAGKVFGMSEPMSVYRVQKGGVTYDKKILDRITLSLPEYYYAIYKNFPAVDRKFIKTVIIDSLCYRCKMRGLSIKTFIDIMSGLFFYPSYMSRKIILWQKSRK